MLKLMIFLSVVLWTGSEQDKLVKTKVTDDITISLPQDFYVMSPEDIARRYPSVRKPLGAYTTGSRLVSFSVNISATQWRPRDIKIAKDFFKASLFHLYDSVNMLREGITTINKREFIAFEFESQLNGDPSLLNSSEAVRTYSYVQYLIVRGKTLVFSFNCPIQLKEKWEDIVPEIMDSIKVKKGV